MTFEKHCLMNISILLIRINFLKLFDYMNQWKNRGSFLFLATTVSPSSKRSPSLPLKLLYCNIQLSMISFFFLDNNLFVCSTFFIMFYFSCRCHHFYSIWHSFLRFTESLPRIFVSFFIQIILQTIRSRMMKTTTRKRFMILEIIGCHSKSFEEVFES